MMGRGVCEADSNQKKIKKRQQPIEKEGNEEKIE